MSRPYPAATQASNELERTALGKSSLEPKWLEPFVPASSVDEVLASSMETVEGIVPPRSAEGSDQKGSGRRSMMMWRLPVPPWFTTWRPTTMQWPTSPCPSFESVEADDATLDERLREMNAAMARLLNKGDEKVEIKEEAAPPGDLVPEGVPSETTEAVAMDTDTAEAPAATGDFVPAPAQSSSS